MVSALSLAWACLLALPALAAAGQVHFQSVGAGLGTLLYDARLNGLDTGARDRVTMSLVERESAIVDAHGSLLLPAYEPYVPNALTNCRFLIGTARCRGEIWMIDMRLRAGNDLGQIAGNEGGFLHGGPGDDVLRGGEGDDSFYGDMEWDTELELSTMGADEFSGGGGTDDVDYSLVPEPVTVTLDDQANDGTAGEGDNVHSDIESVTARSADGNRLVGNSNANTFFGRGVLIGLGGADRLSGTGTLEGGDGPDDLEGGFLTDTIDAGPGEDQVDSSRGDDLIRADDGERDLIVCGEGIDTVHADPVDVLTDCESVNP